MPNRCQTSIIRSAAPTSRSPRSTRPLRAWTTSESTRWGQVAACAANIALASPSFIRPSTTAEASITINGLLARPRHLRRRHRRRLRGPAARPAAQGCRRDVRWKRARAWRTRTVTGPPSQRDAPSAPRPRQARSAGTRFACCIMLARRAHFATALITARPQGCGVHVAMTAPPRRSASAMRKASIAISDPAPTVPTEVRPVGDRRRQAPRIDERAELFELRC